MRPGSSASRSDTGRFAGSRPTDRADARRSLARADEPPLASAPLRRPWLADARPAIRAAAVGFPVTSPPDRADAEFGEPRVEAFVIMATDGGDDDDWALPICKARVGGLGISDLEKGQDDALRGVAMATAEPGPIAVRTE